MLQSFIIVLREGFESFLIVAITLAYLRRTERSALAPAVYWGVAASVLASAALGMVLLRGANLPLWEGIFGLVAAVSVVSLVVHMWRTGPNLKQEMERELGEAAARPWGGGAWLGVFLFTVFMVAREGMETALMLFTVRQGNMIAGALLGLTASGALAWAWARYGHRINVKRFFQVTGVFLVLFAIQVTVYALHELSEAGIFPADVAIPFHTATEAYSPYGIYGRWFSPVLVGVCALWLAAGGLADRRGPVLTTAGR